MSKGRLDLKIRGAKTPSLILFDVVARDHFLEAEAYYVAAAFSPITRVYYDRLNKKKYRVHTLSEFSQKKNVAHFRIEKIILEEVV